MAGRRALQLTEDAAQAIALAAECHDLGKDRLPWQHSIGNDRYPEQVYAKSGSLPDGSKLRLRGYYEGYRHEFGSILNVADRNKAFREALDRLSPDAQDLSAPPDCRPSRQGQAAFPNEGGI